MVVDENNNQSLISVNLKSKRHELSTQFLMANKALINLGKISLTIFGLYGIFAGESTRNMYDIPVPVATLTLLQSIVTRPNRRLKSLLRYMETVEKFIKKSSLTCVR